MTSDIPAPEAEPTATRGQKIAIGALVVALVIWSIAAYGIASLLSSFSGGNNNFVGYAMGAALVVVTPIFVLTSQGPRAAGLAWAIFVGLALLFVPFCAFTLG